MKASLKRGDNFGGVLSYALAKDGTEIVGGTMTGLDADELAAEFALSRQARPDVELPVWHCSLSCPPGEVLLSSQWNAIAADFADAMGLGSHQYVAIRHTDRPHDHIHLIASRIGLDGALWLGRHDVFEAIRATQTLEKTHGLQQTPGLEGGEEAAGRRSPTKNEIERAERLDEAPARLRLQEIIDQAVADRPSVLALLDRLDAAGVTTMPNVASTGKLNGFAFAVDGVAFKGSQLGKAYSWKGLQARGITYEPDRDAESLRDRADRARAEGRQVGGGDPTELNRAPGQLGVEHGAPDRGADDRDADAHGNHGAGPVGGRDRDPRSDLDHRDGGEGGGGADRPSAVTGGRLDPGGIGDGGHEPVAGRDGLNGGVGGSVEGSEGGAPLLDRGASLERSLGPDDWAPVADRVADLAAGTYPMALGGLDVAVPAPRLTPALRAKQEAWEAQHGALQAPAYRVTLKSRVDGLTSFSVGKGRGPDGGERTYTVDEVRALLPYLSAQNARGRDVYLTPLDEAQHFLLLDDATPDSLEAFLASGYRPALVQESSAGNVQAVLRVAREPGPDEQRAANALLGEINTRFGDPKISGAIHPFRMAGFSNRKPGKHGAFTRLLEAAGGLCARTAEHLASIRDRLAQARADRTRPVVLSQALRSPQEPREGFARSDAAARFDQRRAAHTRLAQAQGWPLDESRLDYRAALDLARAGEDPQNVAAAILARSPGLDARHPSDPDGYARRTAEAAARKAAAATASRSSLDEPQGPQGP